MRNILTRSSLFFVVLVMVASCKHGDDSLAGKKAELETLKADQQKTSDKIASLETEIAKLDPNAAPDQKPKLVAIQTLQATDFTHYIVLQGHIDALNVSYITPRSGPAQVKEIYVQQGQMVKKGQLLLKLDDAVLKQNLVAATQGLTTIKSQLAYAKDIYQRQNNLWSENIGTEVQLLTAKNNVTNLEDQLAASQENVKVVQEQVNATSVVSDVDGVADQVTVKQGEYFGAAGSGVIKIVNNSILKAVSNIPENYLNSVSIGSPVIVSLPDLNKTITAKVTFVGASIDLINRGYMVEAKLPSDPDLKPNQLALIKIKDYGAKNAIAIPLNTLQNDDKGKYVLVANTENGKLIAHKRPVEIGLINNDMIEIKSGLKAGDVLITEGFGSLYEGQLITTGAQ
ncbi:MAG TPA: efflux RND transporter periplasmic adaptor subunit [Ferruginibacter sp.]|nr:efflux RND transporter periplasmic adaptor subunit [Ferruginibacter sp.]